MQIDELSALLKKAEIPDYEAVFDELLSFVLNISYSEARLFRILKKTIDDDNFQILKELISRRIDGEPLEYITGYREFYGRRFICEKNVLIPRSDTEILVEEALSVMKNGMKVLDLCTGTGCVGITVSLEKNADVTLADISPYALECSKKNIEKLGADKVKVISHDIFSDKPDCEYDIITSNPPYITENEMKLLSEDVKNEPSLALFGGKDGLDFYRAISERYKSFIKKGGYILFEVGYTQSKAVTEILQKNGFINIKTTKDYNGIERVVSAQNT